MPRALEDTQSSTIRQEFANYRWRCKKLGRNFSITFEEFTMLVKLECWYCGAKPRRINNKTTSNKFAMMNGLDRFDNSIGYEMFNIVTCCSSCNYLKGSLTGDEFLDKIKTIIEHRGNNE